MSKHGIPVSRRLILALADAGGTLTLTEVTHRFYGHITAAAVTQAEAEIAGYVERRKSYSKTTRRPITRLSLTAQGIVLAQTLKPGWKPARLALCDWQAQLNEMTAERVPAALQIARDHEDALLWRNHEAERKRRNREKEQELKKQREREVKYPSAGRNRSDEENEARAKWFRGRIGKSPSYAEADDSDEQISSSAQPAPPAPSRIRPYIPPPLSKIRCPECGNDTSAHVVGCPRWGILDVPASMMSTQQSPSFADFTKTCIVCRSRTLTGDPVDPNHDCENWQPVKI